MQQETRRGFLRAAGVLAGGTALTVGSTSVDAQAGTAAGGEASTTLSAKRAAILRSLHEVVAALVPGVGLPAGLPAYYATTSPSERARVDEALDVIGAAPTAATLALVLASPRARLAEEALSLLAPGVPYRPDPDRGRLLARVVHTVAAERVAPPAKVASLGFVV